MCSVFVFFFFNDTATTEIYTLSLHDALPIFVPMACQRREVMASRKKDWMPKRLFRHGRVSATPAGRDVGSEPTGPEKMSEVDRKSTRLNSSHANISYAVFCLKKKKNKVLRH